MRIALTVDPEIPVPPLYYGGIERIVDMLALGLTARGHDITVFAHPNSTCTGRLVAWPGRSSRSHADTARNAFSLGSRVLAGAFDLVHSFSRLAYLAPILPLAIPKLMTYQRQITRRSVQLGRALSRDTLQFSAISRFIMQDVVDVGTWHLVFNGVPLANYHFCPDPGREAPLVFLGRVERIKGPHLAIKIARRTGIPLVIAGNIPPEHRAFFEAEIAPHVDGSNISYVGPVNDAEKSQLLGRARALLMPVLWQEPFGIVMPEAMACGTPVIGLARGAVPEVVEHGVTGFLGDDVESLAAAVHRLHEIDRKHCRVRAERLFSEEAVTESYLAVYKIMLAARCNRIPCVSAES